MRLSVAIPTYNEEKNIRRCLESVYDWADEIVVVDGTSTDKTVETIRQLDKTGKVKIFLEDNPPNFLINKQKAIDRCTGNWILQLDADEVVSPELKTEIVNIINPKSQIRNSDLFSNSDLEISHSATAYRLPRLNFFLGQSLRKGGQYPDYCLRFYRRGTARLPLKTIHDQVEIISQKSKVQSLKSPLLHYPYPTFEDYLKKWIKYSVFEAEELAKKGAHPSFAHGVIYIIVRPAVWFLQTYLRHKGLSDGFPGFVFSLFSAIRYWVIYIKLYEIEKQK